MPQLPKLTIPIQADLKNAVANLKTMEAQVKKSSSGMSGMVNKFRQNWLGVVAGISSSLIAFKAIIGISARFEQQVANVSSVSGVARGEIEKLARTTGRETVFSAEEAARGLYELSKAGLKTASDMKATLTPSLRLAIVGQMDLAQATETTIKMTNIFDLEMEDSSRVIDVLAKTMTSSVTNMEELSQAMKFAAPVANAVGMSLEDTSAIMGVLANNGITAGMAGRSLRMALLKLIKPTTQGQRILDKYNISMGDLKNALSDPVKLFKLLKPAVQDAGEAKVLLGTRAAGLAAVIRKGSGDLEDMVTALDNAGGAAAQLEKEQLNTLQGSLKLLKSAFIDVILAGTGEGGLREMFKAVIDTLIPLVRSFANFPPHIKALTLSIGLLTPVVVALISIMGPWGALIAGIGAALTLILPKFLDFRDVSEKIEIITDNLTKKQEDYKTVIEKLKDPTKKLSDTEKTLLNVRKELLDIEMREEIEKLAKAHRKLTEVTKDYEKNQTKLNEKLEDAKMALAEARSLDEALFLTREGWGGLLDELKKKYWAQILFEKESTQMKIIEANVTDDLKKALIELEKVQEAILVGRKNKINLQKTELILIDKLAQGIINQKITENEVALLGENILELVKERIIEINKLAEAQKKETKTKKKGNQVSEEAAEMSELEREKLAEKTLAYDEAIAKGIKFEKSLTELTKAEIDKRLKEWERERNERIRYIEEANNALKAGFDLASAIFENYMQNHFDRRNVYEEELKRMDEEELQRRKSNLVDEIDTLRKSGLAKDEALADEKARELEQLNLEASAEEKRKQIAIAEAKANRKMAIAKRIGATFSVIADTAKAIMKSVAAFPPFGLPWSAISFGVGLAQKAAIWAAPLPPIPTFAEGGSFVTKGITPAILGDNPSGRELVNITPLGMNDRIQDVSTKNVYDLRGADITIQPKEDPEEFGQRFGRYMQTHRAIPGESEE